MARGFARVAAALLVFGGGSSAFAGAPEPGTAGSNQYFELRMKGAKGLHAGLKVDGQSITVKSPDEHYIYMVEDALEALGREKNVAVFSSPNFKNGMAFILNDTRGLIFDEEELDLKGDEAGELSQINFAGALLTLAHEIGHHVCGHLDNAEFAAWKQELEADRVAGAILQKTTWRNFFGDLEWRHFETAGMRVLGSNAGSATHPPLGQRLATLKAGWDGEPLCMPLEVK